MNANLQEEIDDFINKTVPEIEKRFTSKEDKRNLRQFLIVSGIGTTKKYLTLILNKLGPKIF
jgi:hypothetical protein